MPHVRQQIREAVAQALMGLPTTGDRVFVSRVYPLEKAELPGLIIITDTDEADYSQSTFSNGQLKMLSRVHLIIKGYVREKTNLDNQLDQIEMEVREALINNRKLYEITKNISWQSSSLHLDTTGEQVIASINLNFLFDYRILSDKIDILL